MEILNHDSFLLEINITWLPLALSLREVEGEKEKKEEKKIYTYYIGM